MSSCVSVSSQLCLRTRSGSAATRRSALDKASQAPSGKVVEKGLGFRHFHVDEFFVVSNFSHGEEMLLRSRSDYSIILVPIVCSWFG